MGRSLPGSTAQFPVQCQVSKSGVFGGWQPLLCCTSLIRAGWNAHAVVTHPSDAWGSDDVAQYTRGFSR